MVFDLPIPSVVSVAPVAVLIGAIGLRIIIFLVQAGLRLWEALPFT